MLLVKKNAGLFTIVICLKLSSVIGQGIIGDGCGLPIPGFSVVCSDHDPNAECVPKKSSAFSLCECKSGYVEDRNGLCLSNPPVNPQVTRGELTGGELTGYLARFEDCLFLLVLDASSMFYPGALRMVYEYYCALKEEDLPTVKNFNLDRSNLGCFGDGIKLLGQVEKSPLYIVKSEVLPCSLTTFYFRVIYSDFNFPETMRTVKVTLRNDFKPFVEIICYKNCAEKKNISKKLVMVADCTNCNRRIKKAMRYQYELLRADFDLKEVTKPGERSATLVINAHSLSPSSNYTLKVTARTPDGITAVATGEIITRPGLTLGTCVVQPLSGYVAVTKHTITCSGFSDPEKHKVQYTLYAVKAKGRRRKRKSEHMVRTTESPIMTDISFPVGDNDDEWKLPIFIEACSASENALCGRKDLGFVKVEFQPEVEIDDLSTSLEDVSGHEEQSAIQQTLTFSSILNSQTETDIEEDEETVDEEDKKKKKQRWKARRAKRKKARAQIVQKLNGIKARSMDVIQQKSSVLLEVTKETGELDSQSLTSGSKVVADLSSNLLSVNENASFAQVEETGSMLVNVVSKMMISVKGPAASDETIDEDDIEPSDIVNNTALQREVTKDLLNALESVKDALSTNKVAGEQATVIATDDLTIKFEKKQAADIGGMNVEVNSGNSTVASKFALPSNFPVPRTKQDLKIEAVSFNSNPYTWSDTALDVTTPVSQLQVKRTDDVFFSQLDVHDLVEPIIIRLPQHEQNVSTFNVTFNSNWTTYIDFNKSSVESQVVMFMDSTDSGLFSNFSLELGFYDFLFDDENFDGTEVPILNTTIQLGSGMLMLYPELPMAGSYAIAMTAIERLPDDVNVTIQMHMTQIKCLYWDEYKDLWSQEGCVVSSNSTRAEIICLCYHMTSFAGGLLVMPNKLNFKEDIAKFLTFWENPVGIIAVSVVLVIYVLLVILARRKDGEDYLRGAVVNLADNDPKYHYNYLVSVQTGSRRNSGTTANVVCVIVGSRRKSEPHVLFSSSSRMCQRGKMDTFVLRTKESLGVIWKLRFWHDNTGKSPEWFVSYCQVIDCQEGEIYDFVCNSWLAECLGENVTLKSFKIATEEQKKDLEFLFFTNTTCAMKDSHMWFSTYAHEIDSNFTTVQRISCCLSLFMTYMLCNIMFYGIEPEKGGEQKMELGPTSITWTELRIGVMSAVLMLPAHILLVMIFKYSRRRYARHLYHVHLDTLKMHLALSSYEGSKNSEFGAALMPGLSHSRVSYLSNKPVESSSVSIALRAHGEPKEDDFYVNDITDLLKGPKKKKCECYLPWWFVYIGWFFLFSIVFACGFFTILYTFNYGLEVSIKWISALVMAFTTDAFLAQPIKVVFIALAFSMIFKKTLTESRTLDINLDHTTFREFRASTTAEELRSSVNVYKPPPQTGSRQGVGKDDKRVYGLFYEILRYLIFLYLVLLITYGKQDVHQYYVNNFITQQVVMEEDMKQATDLVSSWEYLHYTLTGGLFDQNDPEYINDLPAIRLSPPLLIQTRKKPCGAKPSGLLKKLNIVGRHWECKHMDYDKRHYGPDWSRFMSGHVGDENHTIEDTVWQYNTTHKGYVAELGHTYHEAEEVMDYLRNRLWTDRYTNTLRMKAVMYTAQLNLLTLLEVKFSINNPAGIRAEKLLSTFKMYRSTRSFHVFVLVLEAMYALYTLYFAFYVIRLICQGNYFKNVWSFLDLTVVFISFNVIVVYSAHAVMADRAVKTFRATGSMLEFDTVLILDRYVTYSLALLVCCAMLKFVNMLRFNPIIYRFLTILDRAKNGLIWSGFFMFLMIVQYGSMFHIVAAGKLDMFRSVSHSMTTIYLSLMGEYDVVALQEIHPVLGPLAMLSFLIFGGMIGLNIMTSVLIDTLNTVNKEELPNDEARLLELLIDRGLQWMGIKKRPGDFKKVSKPDPDPEAQDETVIAETNIV